jgi:mono/diheme cytochrome c family protein
MHYRALRYALPCWLLLVCLTHVSRAEDLAEKDGDRPDPASPFFTKHCLACHGEKDAKGDLRLDRLSRDFADPQVLETWSKVWQRLHDGEMPPEDQPRPDAVESAAVLRWVADQTRGASKSLGIRRLTRVEFENTLRDLFDLPALDVQEMLPPDGVSQGFDKVGDALGISHVQIAGYLEAVDEALDQATEVALQPARPDTIKTVFRPQYEYSWVNRLQGGAVIPLAAESADTSLYDPETGVSRLKKYEEFAAAPPVKACGTFFHYDGAGRLILGQQPAERQIPRSGMYQVRISTYSFNWDRGKLLPTADTRPFRLGTKSRLLGYFDAPPNDARVSAFDAWLEPAEEFHFNPVSLCHGAGLDKGANSWVGPGVAVEYIEVEGPIFPQWPPAVRTLLYGTLELQPWQRESNTTEPPRRHRNRAYIPNRPPIHTIVSSAPLDDAQTLLVRFMERAYRRRVVAEEARPFVDLVRQSLDRRATLEEALRGAYKAILCSPSFLFLLDDNGQPDDTALASRLSYFLWCAAPDDELMARALDGSLHNPEVLRAQTERLLRDPKSRRFVEDFAGQWLRLRRITATSPDKDLYPLAELESDVAPYLIDSMVAESREFFATMLRDNLSVTNIIQSDFAMVNDIMARRYGLPEVAGSALRPVSLSPGSHRGGILTQASVLKISANGTTTSPVTRGAWVMTNLLGRQPPPPPPNVPAIDPDVRGTTTIRERLAQHRAAVQCAGCHAQFDPAGFALENFDVIGGWRDRYRIITDKGLSLEGPQVDASAELADGRAFHDVDELKALLLADERQIALGLGIKLMLYATGRPPSTADRSELDEIVAAVKDQHYGLRTLVHGIVQSRAMRGE